MRTFLVIIVDKGMLPASWQQDTNVTMHMRRPKPESSPALFAFAADFQSYVTGDFCRFLYTSRDRDLDRDENMNVWANTVRTRIYFPAACENSITVARPHPK